MYEWTKNQTHESTKKCMRKSYHIYGHPHRYQHISTYINMHQHASTRMYMYIYIYVNIYTYTIVKGERNPPNTLVAPQKDDESSPARWWCFHLEKCDADHQDKGYNVDPVNQIAQPCCTALIFVAQSTQTYEFPAAPTLCCLSSPLVLVRKQHGSERGLSKQDCYMSGCHTQLYTYMYQHM